MPDRLTKSPATLVLLLLVPVLVAVAGCHKYVPVSLGPESGSSVERGTRVRVHLTEPGEYRLGEVTPSSVVVIDGEWVRLDGSLLVVSGYRLETVSGREYFGSGETVEVPRTEIRAIEERRVAGLETGLLVAGTVAASVAAGAVVVSGGGGEGGNNGGAPPPAEAVIPFFFRP